MDLKTFLTELLTALADIHFIKDIDFKAEGVVVSGRVILEGRMFLEVYYNDLTKTVAFALIKNEKRIWGVDKDNKRLASSSLKQSRTA